MIQPTQEGEGIIGDLYRGVKNQLSNTGTALSNIWSKGPSYALEVRPKSVDFLITKKGNLFITKVRICRKPINSYFQKFFNFATFGNWEAVKKKMNYDSVFHLYGKLYLSDGSYISIEKNQRLKILYNEELSGVGECTDASGTKQYTVEQMIKNLEGILGKNTYRYDSTTYNCQNFMSSLTHAIDINKDKFILQDTAELFGPWSKYFAKKTTDFASIGDYLYKGGKRGKRKRKQIKA